MVSRLLTDINWGRELRLSPLQTLYQKEKVMSNVNDAPKRIGYLTLPFYQVSVPLRKDVSDRPGRPAVVFVRLTRFEHKIVERASDFINLNMAEFARGAMVNLGNAILADKKEWDEQKEEKPASVVLSTSDDDDGIIPR